MQRLESEVRVALAEQGIRDTLDLNRRLHLRYEGTDTALPVARGEDEAAAGAAFERAHEAEFGFIDPGAALIAEAVEVEGVAPESNTMEAPIPPDEGEARIEARVPLYSGCAWHDAAVVRRDALTPGRHVQGPALVIENN